MFIHPNFSPIALDLGTHTLPVLGVIHPQIHWYGIMYLCGFAISYWLSMQQVKKGTAPFTAAHVEDGIFWGAMGVILGGRLGYVFFYEWDTFVQDPLWLFKIWTGGMSFHGGFAGVLIALFIFSKRNNIRIGALYNVAALVIPIGLGLGRIGNFINQELWGRETDLPWGMIFPKDPLQLVRHPSQLYQAFLEGVVLFGIIYWYLRKPRPEWGAGGVFLIVYGLSRFMVEFVREPDAHIGFSLFGWMSRGQELCIPMIIWGVLLLIHVHRKDAAKNLTLKK